MVQRHGHGHVLSKLQVVVMKFLRGILGEAGRDRIRNTHIRG
jgi:hypothetical protein